MTLNPYVAIGLLAGAVLGTVAVIATSVSAGRSWGSATTANEFLKEKLELVAQREKAEADLKTKGDDYEKQRNALQGQLNRSQTELANLRKSKPLDCVIGPDRLQVIRRGIDAANRAVVNDSAVPTPAVPTQ